MPNIQSNYATGRLPTRICAGAEVAPLFYEITLAAPPLLNDTIEMGPLPAGHVPVDVIYSGDDLDTAGSPLISLSFGVLNSGKTDLSTAAADGGAVWDSALTFSRTGGIARAATKVPHDVAPAETDRPLAFKVTAAAGTFAPGKLRVIVMTRATP